MGSSEAAWFGLPFGTGFSSFVITSLVLHLEEVSFRASPTMPGTTDAVFGTSLQVLGTPVPEPDSLVLCSGGIAALAARRWRRRTRRA